MSSYCRALFIPESFFANRFFQNNNNFNNHGSLLDLVFSNVKSLTVKVSLDSLVLQALYHSPFFILFCNNIHVFSFNNSHTFFNYKRVDCFNIRCFISISNLLSAFSALCLDSALNALYDAFQQFILRFIPMYYLNKSTYLIWFTKELN